jgi:hypothetical protein
MPLTRMGANSAASGLMSASTAPLMAAMPAVPAMPARTTPRRVPNCGGRSLQLVDHADID